jgi:hypothetical protein
MIRLRRSWLTALAGIITNDRAYYSSNSVWLTLLSGFHDCINNLKCLLTILEIPRLMTNGQI